MALDPSASEPFHNTLANITFVSPETETEIEKTQIISNTVMSYINIYLHFMLCGSIALFGIANNIVNMAIFHKIGINDSMSVCLVALSLTDFLVSFLSVVRIGFFMWDLLLPDSIIDPLAVNHVSIGWWRDLLFLCSAWITTFLSIERCVCVVFPFRVKDIFTKFRSIIVVVIIYIVHIAVHMPIFLSQWLDWATVEVQRGNETVLQDRLVAKFSDNRPQIQFYIDIANGAVLPMPSQALVLVSVFWMIYGLKVSSRVRMVSGVSDKVDNPNKKESNLSNKERRLVKVVLFLAIILTFCNIPRFVAVYAKQLFPEVSFRSSYGNLYMLLWNVAILASIVNSSVNIFVYLIVNTNYRQRFKEMFCAVMQRENTAK